MSAIGPIVVKAGTTDVSVTCRALDSTTGAPVGAFDHSTSGIDLEYRREGAVSTDITEASLAALTTAHTDGGVEYIGNGYFRLDLPDAACAAGVTGVLIHGTATGVTIIGPYIQLVAYDPYDADRLGLVAPSDIESALVIANSRLLVVKSDTSDIMSSLVIVKSDTLHIESDAAHVESQGVVIKSQLLIVKSDTSDIRSHLVVMDSMDSDNKSSLVIVKSQLAIVKSDAAHIESDVVLGETIQSDIKSSLVIAKSQLVIIKSDALHIESDAARIDSATTVVKSQLLIVKSDTSDIRSHLVVMDAAASDIKSELTKVYSDTTAIAAAGGGLTVAQDSKLTRISSDLIVVDDLASDIHSSLVITKSQLLIVKSDTSDIRSHLVVMDAATSDVKSQLVIVASDAAAINLDTAATLALAGTTGVVVAAASKTGYRLSATGVADLLATALTESYAADGAAPTLSQALFQIQQFLMERAISTTTMTIKKLDGTTTAMTLTLDDANSPTSITRAS